MSKIKKQLTELSGYLGGVRQVGHTHTMLHGAAHVKDVCIVSPNHKLGDLLKKDAPKATIITLNGLQYLRDRNQPLVFDNAALYQLFTEAVEEITRLENKANDPHQARRPEGEELAG